MEPLCGQHHPQLAGSPDGSVGCLASGQGKQDRNQRNGHQRVSANIGRRVATVNMDRMSQQRSDRDGRDHKRDNVTEARIEGFLKIRISSYLINISCFLSLGWPPVFRYLPAGIALV